MNTVPARYFAAAGLPILGGRDFRDGETAALIVNEQMGARFWPGQDPIGKTMAAKGSTNRFAVAGVVRDGRIRTFRDAEVAPCLYLPLDTEYKRMITLYVRTAGSPLSVAAGVQAAMRGMNGDLPFEAKTLATHLETALSRERLAAKMLAALGAFTTLLASIGLYGIISVAVSQRAGDRDRDGAESTAGQGGRGGDGAFSRTARGGHAGHPGSDSGGALVETCVRNARGGPRDDGGSGRLPIAVAAVASAATAAGSAHRVRWRED